MKTLCLIFLMFLFAEGKFAAKRKMESTIKDMMRQYFNNYDGGQQDFEGSGSQEFVETPIAQPETPPASPTAWVGANWQESEQCKEQSTKDYFYSPGPAEPFNNEPMCGLNSRLRQKTGPSSLKRMYTEPEALFNNPAKALRTAKIVGGQEARRDEYPFLVALGSLDAGPACGGSLIASQWVLSAAHCFKDKMFPCKMNLRMGEHNLKDPYEKHVDILAEKVFIHPEYNDASDTLPYDIALVKLSRPVPEDQENINYVCLPSPGEKVTPMSSATVAGWGDLKDNSATYPQTPHMAAITVFPAGICRGYDNLYGRGAFNPKTMICAGTRLGTKDSCQGDSGGPLVVLQDGRYVQVGIVSMGIKCGSTEYPGLYVNVAHYIDWINEVMSQA